MKKTTLACYVVSAMACFSIGMNTANATTDSLDLTVVTKVTAGTCSAEVQENTKTVTDIDFQDVFIPEVINKSKAKKFDLKFTNCAATSSAEFTLKPASGSTCDKAGGGEAFANASVATPKAAAVAVEVWGSANAGSGTQLKCKSANAFPVTMVGGGVTVPLSARLIRDSGKTDADVTAGEFSSQAVFDITYK
ncbi:fimbrial protein [Escherichia marmotae]|uniref:Fimbrial protein n=1 Tax=Escherichia marmotae TaxID=1499973 RepID=A0A7L5X1Y7_9ESCH|nr:fimbrial protein [Escherichia marmotae]MED8812932.1 fimbrial protein [Escherichia marmotae]MED9351638.1 fimbrial protein [Escherichia marmotae]MED9358059.1 fimbrial protein [Escherichia marmotae]QLP25850.1 fimbrial protein [Escherichia marmotae]